MIRFLMSVGLNPGIFLMICYLASYVIPVVMRRLFLMLSSCVAMVVLFLTYTSGDLYFWVAVALFISLLCGILFAARRSFLNSLQFAVLYLGAAISIVLSNNLFLMFISFEIMLIAATFMIFNGGNQDSEKAGFNYFKFHIFSGALFLMASLFYFDQVGDFELVPEAFHQSSWLKTVMLTALLINIAMPPFSQWLIFGYSATSSVGAIFLSVGISKISVLLILKLFLGCDLLITLGLIMAFYGVFYSCLEANIRRNFNYGIIAQLGMILIAIGAGGELGKRAASFFIIAEIIYIAGCAMFIACFYGENKRFNKFFFVIALLSFLSVAAFPLTPGYVAKTLLLQISSISVNAFLHYSVIFLSIGITIFVAIKIPAKIFINLQHEKRLLDVGFSKIFSVFVMSCVIIGLGVFPDFMLGYSFKFLPKEILSKILEISFCAVISFCFFDKLLNRSMRPKEIGDAILDFLSLRGEKLIIWIVQLWVIMIINLSMMRNMPIISASMSLIKNRSIDLHKHMILLVVFVFIFVMLS